MISQTSGKMKILIITYHHLDSNSGIHVFNIANQLIRLGIDCAVCVPNDKKKVFDVGEPLFETFTPQEIQENASFMNDVDLIHIWTPREITRKITTEILKSYKRPYIVHLEDNEKFLMETLTGTSFDKLKRLPEFLLNLLIRKHISHPIHYQEFLASANGLTLITEALAEYSPPGVPYEVIWAGYQEDMPWDNPSVHDLKSQLGISKTDYLIVYTGNVHLANQHEVSVLYEAVRRVNQLGIPVKLIRTGSNYIPFKKKSFGKRNENYFLEMGRIPRKDLPAMLSIADVLVQPGVSNRFNDYRFPSKIPEYLASGKPVVLPKTNIGLHLKNNEECILLENGSVDELTEKLVSLLNNEPLRKKIGFNGHKYAEQNLKWSQITKKLSEFYKLVIKEYRN